MANAARRAKSPPQGPLAQRPLIKFECEPPIPPAAVAAISDPSARDIATEVHNAAWTICRCIEEWSEWIYPETGRDFDEFSAVDVHRKCSAALFALYAHRAFTPTFRDCDSVDALVKLLPIASAASIRTRPEDFRQAVTNAMEAIGPWYAECSAILDQMEVAPLVAIGWGADSCPEPTRERTTDRPADREKKLPENAHVTRCAKFVRKQLARMEAGEIPTAERKAIVQEYLENQHPEPKPLLDSFDKNFQPSRYGWLLNLADE